MPPPSEILVEHLPLVDRLSRAACRGSYDIDSEEFTGFVHLRLVENDYAIIRAFAGRSTFSTYLVTVIARLLNDYRNHEWGKWHDSAEAKRLGAVAVELERLIVRDKRSLEEAFSALRTKHPDVTKEFLEEIAARLPARYRRRMVALDERPEPSIEPACDDTVTAVQTATVVSKVVRQFIERLPKDDQLLFYLRFESAMSVPQIANSLHADMQSLYRKLRLHFGDLRRELESAGVSAADIVRLIDADLSVLDFQLKSDDERPSNEPESGAEPEEDA